jgi:RecA-family ATPase
MLIQGRGRRMNAHMPTPNPLISLALGYAKRGWRVFPCNPLTKRPITTNGHLEATNDPATIGQWWTKYPNAMIGCATGPKSGFWALDADRDQAAGKDGVAALAQMGDLPDTVEQSTPRGGAHKFFRWDDNRPVRNSASKLGPGIDTRGDGGYVILAGSIRSDGAAYQWSLSPENGEIREAPDWLYARIEARTSKPEAPIADVGTEFPFEIEIVTAEAARGLKEQCLAVAGAAAGKRNNTLNEAAYVIGLRVGMGELPASRARDALTWAAEACGLTEDDGEDSIHKTIASGLTAGAAAGVKRTPAYWHEEVAGEDVKPEAIMANWSQPASLFAGKAVPAQRWLAGEMIPARTVTLLYGDGGTGKSLVTLQLAFAVATGTRWLGMEVTRGAALFVTAEDEPEEVHRRVVAVASGSGLALEDIGDLHWRSLAGEDAVLAAPNSKGLLEPTKRFAELRAEIVRLRPALVVLDTLADLFGGDEIKRIQARQFIQILQSLIVGVAWDMTIMLLAHPSVAGMNSGTGTSGSTGWSNSVRSRLYLERRFGERGGEKVEIDADIRVLSTKKANRTKQGGEVVVRWSAGRFIAQTAVSSVRDQAADADDEAAFLSLLAEFDRSGRHVSPNVSAPTYAPKLFLSHPTGEQVGKKGLEAAMSRLFGQRVIAVKTYGPPSKAHSMIVKRADDLFG